MTLLEVQRVRKEFGGIIALDNIDLCVKQGEILGIIGPNGAGKTTLINVVTKVYPATRGHVIFKGEDITRLRRDQVVKKGIARTFQEIRVFKRNTVMENILIAYHLHVKAGFFHTLFNTQYLRREQREMVEKAQQLLDLIGLWHSKDAYVADLPHGHQRMLSIGLALAVRPELLLLDEPLSGMNLEEVETMLKRLQGILNLGITIVMIEHNVRAVMDLCHRIVVLNYGEKIAEGLPEEIKSNPEVITAYLGAEEYVT